MKNVWFVTVALGAALAAGSPAELAAQGNSQRARQQAQQQQAQREAERERLRAERDAQARQDAQRQTQAQRDAERERLRVQREAQARQDAQRANGRYDDRNSGRYDDRWERDRRGTVWGDWERDDRARGNGRNGPAFCRSGEGHPVWGRQWCRDKGFGLGNERWDTGRWGDIILRDRNRRYNEPLTRNILSGLLGPMLLTRFEQYGRGFGGGALSGYWLPGSSGTVLQLMIGGVPIAQLVDYNRDGRIDNLLLRR